MLDDEAAMPPPGKGIITGKAAVAEAFRASPAFKEGHVSWAPVRGGISADGTQGFTYGFLDRRLAATPPGASANISPIGSSARPAGGWSPTARFRARPAKCRRR